MLVELSVLSCIVVKLMPPRSTRTQPLFPSSTLFRSGAMARKIYIFVTCFVEVQKPRQFAAAAYACLTASGTQTLVNRGFRTAQTRCDSLDGMPGDQQAQNFHFPVGEACGQARNRFIGKHVFRSPQPHEQVHPNLIGKRQQDQTEHGEKRALKHRRQHEPEGDDSNKPTLNRRPGPHPQMTTAFRVYGYPFAKSFIAIDVSARSEEHTSELQSLMRISYAVFCLKKKIIKKHILNQT